MLVAGTSTDATGFSLSGSAKLQGAAYAVTAFSASGSSTVQGPVVARQLDFRGAAASRAWTPIRMLPWGSPSANTAPKVELVHGSFDNS